MKRVLKIIVSSSEVPVYELGTRFTQGDNKSHILEIRFKDEIDFNGKSLKVNFIRADGVVVTTIVTKLSKITSVEVPTNALSVVGELGVELVVIQGDTVLTINKVVKLRVVSTTAGQGNEVIAGDNFLNEIHEITVELLAILNGKADEQVKRLENTSLQEQTYLQQQSDKSKKEIKDLKDKTIIDINNQKSLIQETVNKGLTDLNNKGEQIKVELDLILNNADVTNVISLIGNSYRGVYSSNSNYIDGDIYYKKESDIISFEIPNTSSSILTKLNQKNSIKKFYKIVNGMEQEFHITANNDNSVVGFVLDSYVNTDRINSSIIFEMPIINHTVSITIPTTTSSDLVKIMEAVEKTPIPSINKTQRDIPLTSSLTQKNSDLRKFNY